MAKMTADEARTQEISAIRSAIVASRIAAFADKEGAHWTELPAKAGARYFLVDDIVLVVRLRSAIDKDRLDETSPKEVLWQHTVALVGIDITERIVEINRGTLGLLEFELVRRAFAQAAHLVHYSHIVVVEQLYGDDTIGG